MKRKIIEIEINSVPWQRVAGLEKRLCAAAELTLASLPEALIPAARRAEIALLLTTDAAVRKLNKEFRGIDKATNVLSFPSFSRRDLVRIGRGQDIFHAGDIAIAFAYSEKEARQEGKIFLDHVTHLMIHGILHLFGFDHDTDSRAMRMERLEKVVLAGLGIPDPYSLEPETEPRGRIRK